MALDAFYINLGRSSDRRAAMEQQLAMLGLQGQVQRFEAIDGLQGGPFATRGENGIYGCFCSHRDAILASGAQSATVILEDDVELSADFPRLVTAPIIDAYTAANPTVDLIFLECLAYVHAMPELLLESERYMPDALRPDLPSAERRRTQTVSIVDAHNKYSCGAVAYIVTPTGKNTLRRLFDDLRIHGGLSAIDTLYNRWIGARALQAAIFVPFLATPSLGSLTRSTIDYQDFDAHLWSGPASLVALYHATRRLLFAGDVQLDRIEQGVRPALDAQSSSDERRLALQVLEAIHLAAQHGVHASP